MCDGEAWLQFLQPDVLEEEPACREDHPVADTLSPHPSTQHVALSDPQAGSHERLEYPVGPVYDRDILEACLIEDLAGKVGHQPIDAFNGSAITGQYGLPLQQIHGQPSVDSTNSFIDHSLPGWPACGTSGTLSSNDQTALGNPYQLYQDPVVSSIPSQPAMSEVRHQVTWSNPTTDLSVPAPAFSNSSDAFSFQDPTVQTMTPNEPFTFISGQHPVWEPHSVIGCPSDLQTPTYDGLYQNPAAVDYNLNTFPAPHSYTNDIQQQLITLNTPDGVENDPQTFGSLRNQQLAAPIPPYHGSIGHPPALPAMSQHELNAISNQVIRSSVYEQADDVMTTPFGTGPLAISVRDAGTNPSFNVPSGNARRPSQQQIQARTNRSQSQSSGVQRATKSSSSSKAKRAQEKQQLTVARQLSRIKGIPPDAVHVMQLMCPGDSSKVRRTDAQRENKKNVTKQGGSCLICHTRKLKCSGERPCSSCKEYWLQRIGASTDYQWTCDVRLRLSDIELPAWSGTSRLEAGNTLLSPIQRNRLIVEFALEQFPGLFGGVPEVFAVVDLLETRPHRLILADTPKMKNIFVIHSYMQSLLLWKDVILGYAEFRDAKSEMDVTYDLIEESYHEVHRYIKRYLDDEKHFRPPEDKNYVFYFVLFFEDMMNLFHFDSARRSIGQELSGILQGRLQFVLARSFDPNTPYDKMEDRDAKLLWLLNTVDCLVPCILPQHRKSSNGHWIKFLGQQNPHSYRSFDGLQLDLPARHQPQCCLNWMIPFIPVQLFWIFNTTPAQLSETFHNDRLIDPFPSWKYRLSETFRKRKLRKSSMEDYELYNEYTLWLAIQITTRELFRTSLVGKPSRSSDTLRLDVLDFSDGRVLFLEILFLSSKLFQVFHTYMERLKEEHKDLFDYVARAEDTASVMEICITGSQ